METIYAYLAGVIDSDGYITIKRLSYNIRVAKDSTNATYSEMVGIKQTSNEAIVLINELFGGHLGIEKPNTPNGKPLYRCQLTNKKAVEFIKCIYPYLRIKKKQAEILLRLRELNETAKTNGGKIEMMGRWGKVIEVTRYKVSADIIQQKESLRDQIRLLNDTRDHPALTPKAY